jgi:hypothetical protein
MIVLPKMNPFSIAIFYGKNEDSYRFSSPGLSASSELILATSKNILCHCERSEAISFLSEKQRLLRRCAHRSDIIRGCLFSNPENFAENKKSQFRNSNPKSAI